MSRTACRSMRLLHAAAGGTLRSPHLLKKLERGFPPSAFKNRLVVDADASGLGLNALFAVSAGAKHVYSVCPSPAAAAAADRLLRANGVCPEYASALRRGALPEADMSALRVAATTSVTKPPLVTASAADLVDLQPLAIAHLLRTIRGLRVDGGTLAVHPTLTITAQPTHLPGHYRQCAVALGCTLDDDVAAAGESAVRRDAALGALCDGLVDLATLPTVLHDIAVPAQAWRVQLTEADMPRPGGSEAAPRTAHFQCRDWLRLAASWGRGDQRRQQQAGELLCEIPFRISEPVRGTSPDDAAPTLRGLAIVLWASVAAGGAPALTSAPTAVSREHRGDTSGASGTRPRRQFESREEFEALRALAPESLSQADAPPVVLFLPADAARRCVADFTAPRPPKPFRNTVLGRRQRSAAEASRATSDDTASWRLEGRLRVRCPFDGDADSLTFELLRHDSDDVVHAWS